MENKQQDFGKGEHDYRIDSPKVTLLKSNTEQQEFHSTISNSKTNDLEKLLEIEQDKNRILLLERQIWSMKENLLNKVFFEKSTEPIISSVQSFLSSTPPTSIVRVGQEDSNRNFPQALATNLLKKKLPLFPINEDFDLSPSSIKQDSSYPSTESPPTCCSLVSSKNSSIRISTLDETSERSDTKPIHHHEDLSEIKLDRNAIPTPPPKPLELTLRKSQKESMVLLDKRQFLFKQFLCSLKEYQQILQVFIESYINIIEENSTLDTLKRHVTFDHLKTISDQNDKTISEISILLSRNGIILVGEEQSFIVQSHHLFEMTQSNYISFFDHYFSILQLFKNEKSKSPDFKQVIRKIERELVGRKFAFWKFESLLSIPSQFIQKILMICEKLLKSSDKFYIGLEHYAKLGQLVIILRDLHKYSKSKMEISNDLSQLLEISKNLSIDGLVSHKRKVIHLYFMAERVRDCGNVTPCQLFLFNDMFLIKYPRKYRWFKMKVLIFHLDEINRSGLPMNSIRCKDSEIIFIRGDFECKQTKLCIRFKNEEESNRWKDDILNCIEKECLQLC